MVEITFNARTYEVTAKGHAMADEEGKDIVCAAVSTLMYTLADSLSQCQLMIEEGTFESRVKKGDMMVKCTPKEDFIANIETIYWVILNGCNALVESYPEYVTLTQIA